MIYGVSPSNKRNWTHEAKKIKVSFINCFFKFRIARNHIGTYVTNQYLKVKNWKLNPIVKSKDRSAHKLQEKLKKGEIIEKLIKLVQLLKDEGFNPKTEESPTNSSNSYKKPLTVSSK